MVFKSQRKRIRVQILEKVKQTIAAAACVGRERVGEKTSLRTDLKLDEISLSDVRMALEEEFGVIMEDEFEFDTASEAADYISKGLV